MREHRGHGLVKIVPSFARTALTQDETAGDIVLLGAGRRDEDVSVVLAQLLSDVGTDQADLAVPAEEHPTFGVSIGWKRSLQMQLS